MSWSDRLGEAAYTSASGVRLTFNYEDLSRDVTKKTSAREYVGINGTFIQDFGHSGRRYPVKAIFWGAECDIEADNFEATLLEKGAGKLEHPLYGSFEVVPFGDISREDRVVSEANQTIVSVTFFETLGVVYPSATADKASTVITAVDEFNTAEAESFAASVADNTVSENVIFKNAYQTRLDACESGLAAIAGTEEKVRREFNRINASINGSIDILIADPLTLAFQTVLLIQAPARAITSILARLEAYGNLLDSIIDQSLNYFSDELYASAYVAGSVVSVVNNTFLTRSDAVRSAEVILDQFQRLINWRDANNPGVDTGEMYQQLQEAVAIAAGFLVEISFTLKQERTIVLDRARTIIDLAAELYGEVDSKLDFLISTNKLTGSEIKELPRGRKIVYYV